MWSLGGTRIITQAFDIVGKAIIPRLQPVDAGTVLQYFGYEKEIYQLSGKVVGETNLAALKTMLRSGNSRTLVTDQGNKTVYISSISAKRDEFIWQSIDPTQECDAPVYSVTLELYE
jgi:phage protein U